MKNAAQRAFLYAKLEKKEPAKVEKKEPKKKGLKAIAEKAEILSKKKIAS
jgi:hypothetical protein